MTTGDRLFYVASCVFLGDSIVDRLFRFRIGGEMTIDDRVAVIVPHVGDDGVVAWIIAQQIPRRRRLHIMTSKAKYVFFCEACDLLWMKLVATLGEIAAVECPNCKANHRPSMGPFDFDPPLDAAREIFKQIVLRVRTQFMLEKQAEKMGAKAHLN